MAFVRPTSYDVYHVSMILLQVVIGESLKQNGVTQRVKRSTLIRQHVHYFMLRINR